MASKGESYKEHGHAKKLVASLNEYRLSNFMCDVVLVTDSKEFLAHRNVLCASSPYFLDHLASSSTSGNSETTIRPSLGARIELANVKGDVLEDILNFIYKGEICVGEENVRKLISASDILRMTNLKEIACRFYEKRLCPTNCINIAALAEEFNCNTLKVAADSFILKHFLEILHYQDFKQLTCNHIIRIISSDEINAETEEQIFTAAMEWLHYDLDNRHKFVPNILSCIRLLLTSKYFIRDVIEQDHVLNSDPHSKAIIEETKFLFEFPDRKHIIKYREAHKPRAFSDLAQIIIACGGNQERLSTNEVLCYVPSQDFWYPLAPMIDTRYHSYTVVKDNTIYSVGGKNEAVPLRSVERYLFASDKWTESTHLPITVSNHVACVFNGEIYVIGGESGGKSIRNAFRFSTSKSQWVEVKGLTIPRRSAAVAVHKQLYVIGGYGPDSQAVASVERFDPYLNEWSKIFPMNSARAGASAVCIENKIYVFGGEYAMWSYYRSCEVFDIQTDEWKMIGDMSIPRAFMGVAHFEGIVYVIGGMVSAEGTDQYGVGDDEEQFVDVNESNLVECYDYNSNSWTQACSLPAATADINCGCITVSKSLLESRCGIDNIE